MNDTVLPHWVKGTNYFWYKRQIKSGFEFRLVNAEFASNTVAFDHNEMANVLTEASGKAVTPNNLPLKDVKISLTPLKVSFHAFNRSWLYDTETLICQERVASESKGMTSPDGKSTVFVQGDNLWVRDMETGSETALTHDGTVDNYYGSVRSPLSAPCEVVQAQWSDDSKHLLTLQQDVREVASRPVVNYTPSDGSLHPKLTQIKVAYPGDKHVETCRILAINVETGQVRKADYPPLSNWGLGGGFFSEENLGWWSFDSRHAYFVDVGRGAKVVRVVEFDTYSGATRVLFEETSDTFVKLSHIALKKPLFLPLPESNELIWFSERTGWGHLYLYDLSSGEMKHPVTEGEWLVREVLHYNSERREVLVQTAARDKNVSPHYRDVCKINIDSGKLNPLISGCYDYTVYQPDNPTVGVYQEFGLEGTDINGVSPSGEYIVTTKSRVDTIPVSVLIDRSGREIIELEVADVSGLPSNWVWPEPVKVKGADDQTDIYGVMFRPPGFSPNQSYPVLDFSCSIRNYSYIPHGSFINGPCFSFYYLLGAALSALGFIVVALDARGTPNRDKKFQDHNYGDVASTCDFEDRISGLQQLAKKYPYMDLDRVGITGGDNLAAPVYGLLNYPDFYKVAVAHCFIEPQFQPASFGEQREGILADTKLCCAEDSVESLKGKLLLIQGMLDPTTPASTFRLVDALQKANKDFDMLCLPNSAHEIPTYALRRNWDYLVKHLLGINPPKEFNLTTGFDLVIDAYIKSAEISAL